MGIARPLTGRLRVDERALARHRDGLLQGADRHLAFERRGERRGQRDPVPDDGAEAGQREGDLVGAGLQRDDAVLCPARR